MSVKQPLHKIYIEEFSQSAKPNAIRGLYLSLDNYVDRFLKNEEAFIFDGFTLVLCTAGICILKINGRSYEVRAGSLLFLSPNQLMEQIHKSADFRRRIIVFSLDFVLGFPSPMDTDIINMVHHSPVIKLPDAKMELLLEYYRFLEREYENFETPYREAISKSILCAMMLEVVGLYEMFYNKSTNEKDQRQEQIVDDFFWLLARYYKKERNVSFYAEKMNRTPKYLSCRIKRITGRSIIEWLNEAVLIEVKLQLKTTDRTILQISEELNFSSPSVLVRFFRFHTGTTPLQYRKSI